MMTKKRYDSIDLMKFIACFFVVAIHADPLYEINESVNFFICQGISRLAVPLYFLTTSFFFFNDLSFDKLKKYSVRLLKLYGCWFVISLPITIYSRFIISDFSFGISLLKFIKSLFFTSTFSGSWYLTSCLFCGMLFYFLEKLPTKIGNIIAVIISVLSYLLCVMTSAYGNLLEQFCISEIFDKIELYFAKPYTSVLAGIPYFALGRYLNKNKEKGIHTTDYIVGGVSIMLFFIEILMTYNYGLNRAYDCYFMALPVALFIFTIIINTNCSIKYASSMKTASTIVFFSHFIWLFIIEFMEYILKIPMSNILKYIIALTLSLTTSFVIEKLEKIKTFKWMKYLH